MSGVEFSLLNTPSTGQVGDDQARNNYRPSWCRSTHVAAILGSGFSSADPRLRIFKRTTPTTLELLDPSVTGLGDVGSATACDFTPDGEILVTAGPIIGYQDPEGNPDEVLTTPELGWTVYSGRGLTFWSRSGDAFTPLEPRYRLVETTLPSFSRGSNQRYFDLAKWDPTSTYLAFRQTSFPASYFFKRVGNTITKLHGGFSGPNLVFPDPGGYGTYPISQSLEWSPDGTYLADGDNWLVKHAGDSFSVVDAYSYFPDDALPPNLSGQRWWTWGTQVTWADNDHLLFANHYSRHGIADTGSGFGDVGTPSRRYGIMKRTGDSIGPPTFGPPLPPGRLAAAIRTFPGHPELVLVNSEPVADASGAANASGDHFHVLQRRAATLTNLNYAAGYSSQGQLAFSDDGAMLVYAAVAPASFSGFIWQLVAYSNSLVVDPDRVCQPLASATTGESRVFLHNFEDVHIIRARQPATASISAPRQKCAPCETSSASKQLVPRQLFRRRRG